MQTHTSPTGDTRAGRLLSLEARMRALRIEDPDYLCVSRALHSAFGHLCANSHGQ